MLVVPELILVFSVVHQEGLVDDSYPHALPGHALGVECADSQSRVLAQFDVLLRVEALGKVLRPLGVDIEVGVKEVPETACLALMPSSMGGFVVAGTEEQAASSAAAAKDADPVV